MGASEERCQPEIAFACTESAKRRCDASHRLGLCSASYETLCHEEKKMRIRLNSSSVNIGANIALVLAALVFGGSVWWRFGHGRQVPATGAVSLFRLGDRAPAILGVEYGAAERSLILFLSTTCRYCEADAPFYNQLHDSALASGRRSQLYFVFAETSDRVKEYKVRTGLEGPSLSGVELRRVGVRSTPTALLVDRNGVIKGAWVGSSKPLNAEILVALSR